MDYKVKVAELIKQHVDLEIETIEKLIEIPPKPEMGDYAFPCFQLSKVMRKAPNMIAVELKILGHMLISLLIKEYLQKIL